ncbi:glutamine amidotransferase [Serinibacter arcticus]|uniref:Glutamine amidotransferase n=1 Tax=Serinibacter arcticus TaxID=1655435 RepID=A0A2U1ZRX3_9MICO|nr:glutamine amidotransferase [Serinibacter arcticus]PWD49672.1 glutamine amidotransferase [Serinibacter arcticus]
MPRTALALRHVPFEDLGLLDPLLRERGYEVAYLDVGVDALAEATVLAADLVVVLGGPIGVYESEAYPFLDGERATIAARLAAGGPILGVCLGAQLVAAALGAPVTATGRKEIGFGELTLTPEGRASVLAPLEGVPVLHWHGDEFAVPDGGASLARTPGFPNQAFAIGAGVLALQFHLEADHTVLERWLIGHAHEIATAGVDPGRLRADAVALGPALAVAAREVLGSWLDALPDAPR